MLRGEGGGGGGSKLLILYTAMDLSAVERDYLPSGAICLELHSETAGRQAGSRK